MLQPLQLREVWSRYAHDITELQDFFVKADCAVGAPDSLAIIMQRLQRDRLFHRDLTSHLWVVIHAHRGNVSFADLVGMVAISSAGLRFASEAHEEDAHALLRYLMEVRQELDGVSEESATVAPAAAIPAIEPSLPVAAPEELLKLEPPAPEQQAIEFQRPERLMPEPEAAPIQRAEPQLRPLPTRSSQSVEEVRGNRRNWVALAACLLVVAVIGLFVHSHVEPGFSNSDGPLVMRVPTATQEQSPAPAEVVPAPASETAPAPTLAPRPQKKSAYVPLSQSKSARIEARNAPTPRAPIVVSQPAPALASAVAPPPSAPAPVVRVVNPPVAKVAAAPAPVVTSASSTAHGTRPVGNLGYGSAVVADFSHMAPTEHAGPYLRRRTPEDKADLLAEARPPDLPGAVKPLAAPASAGIVRAESLGASASNVIYSPTPDYPAAASAARIQGEVKVQTEVDRNGNISSVRVISGPPLLREAALNAAQRWRFRPNRIGGQVYPMSAVTVFNFQLP